MKEESPAHPNDPTDSPMSKTMENVKTINSVVRTGLMVTLLALLGYAGWYTYSTYIEPSQRADRAMEELETLKAQFDEQKEELQVAKKENQHLKTANHLLKVDRRLANIHVVKKGETEDGEPFFDVTFEEVDKYGDPVSEVRSFQLRGEELYVDCWICNFEDKYVENADELRNASLCIFKKIYGDIDGLKGGYALDRQDENGEFRAPGIYYRGSEYTDFEKKIWEDFWTIASDPKLQKEMGIKAQHGQVNYLRVQEGRIYQVEVRASSGMTITPLAIRTTPKNVEKKEEKKEVDSGEGKSESN
jgi:hypothetical protein